MSIQAWITMGAKVLRWNLHFCVVEKQKRGPWDHNTVNKGENKEMELQNGQGQDAQAPLGHRMQGPSSPGQH